MTTTFILYAGLLLLEGVLAWVLSGQGFLLAVVTASLALYASLREATRSTAEGVRIITALVLVIAGPLTYQTSLTPLLLCFIALPHFLAATQALAEKAGPVPSRDTPAMKSMVFTIAFYTSLGLLLLLTMGMEPQLSRGLTSSLAVGVLFTALPAWDLSRIPRLRPGLPGSSRSAIQRFFLPAGLLAAAAFMFNVLLPPAADWLCRLSPRWRMDSVEFQNKPPKPPPASREAGASQDGEATRPGVDESSVTGEHRLPPRSNLKSSDAPRFFIQPDSPALTSGLLVKGPAYVRSHTLNKFRDNRWSPEVSGGAWVEDGSDGNVDGFITLRPAPPVAVVPHEVFALDADGYTVPALAGLTAMGLPRVYKVPGDVLQSAATGDIRYRAVSAPVIYQSLPNPALLQTALPGDRVHLSIVEGELGIQLQRLADSIFGQEKLLADQIDALHAFFAEHYTYSTVMRNPNQLGALENFLFDERQGHCDFYASAAALLLRKGGVPTRVAYGFASQEADPATGLITVRDRHAHAWTEIFLTTYGWTICDFTPPGHIGQPTAAPAPSPPVPKPDPKAFADAAKDIKLPSPAKAPESQSLLGPLLTWFQQQPWLASAMQHGPVVLLGLATLIIAARWLRRHPVDVAAAEAAKARALYEQQPSYFREFLRLATRAGHPKPDGRTPWEHYQILEEAGLPVPQLLPLIQYHCAVRYEDVPRDAGREKNFQKDLKAFAVALPASDARAEDLPRP